MPHQVIIDGGPCPGGTAFVDPVRVIRADTPDAVPAAFAAMEAAKAQGCWLAGYASYELGYAFSHKLHDLMPPDRTTPLLEFGVFDGPAPAQVALSEGGAFLSDPHPVWDLTTYSDAFDRIKAYIAAGDIYQANLTFPVTARYTGTPLELYATLRNRQPVPHGAFVDLGGPVLLSRSPELFFAIDRTGGIEVKPMKGTVARGQTPDEDAARISVCTTFSRRCFPADRSPAPPRSGQCRSFARWKRSRAGRIAGQSAGSRRRVTCSSTWRYAPCCVTQMAPLS